MTPERFHSITENYGNLRVGVVGDFCLDRYLEIDPARKEISIETGLPVYNVTQVRSQPGGAGTILNNLAALGIGAIYPVGFAGDDGEGFELIRSLGARPGVQLEYFLKTDLRRTFTYTKPLLVDVNQPPIELNRLDFKNWSATPDAVDEPICRAIESLAGRVDALIVLDQVNLAHTGVITPQVLNTLQRLSAERPDLFIVADSRRSLKGFPPLAFKMNQAEFNAFADTAGSVDLGALQETARHVARTQKRHVFVTLAERGIVGAAPPGEVEYVPALPVRGPIDIVGAGDAVTANLAVALSARAQLREALELAMLAASLVVHQLGTTGTATVAQLQELQAKWAASTPGEAGPA